MTHELHVLVLAALLQVVQFALYSITAQRQVGQKAAFGPRDTTIELTDAAGRLQRAMNTHFEGLILFSIAAIALTLAEKSSTFTAICASAYLIARLLYIPAYVQGLTPWRSLIWFVGFAATVLMLIAALL
ncbi:MAG: MAPEG family protein [Rhodobacteraceae bacterium]|nr:MAPEG family protein [Paracoccaceae bacterium]